MSQYNDLLTVNIRYEVDHKSQWVREQSLPQVSSSGCTLCIRQIRPKDHRILHICSPSPHAIADE